MVRYLITWESNNGYTCHCCSQTWQSSDIETFENDEEAQAYLDRANKKFIADERQLINFIRISDRGIKYLDGDPYTDYFPTGEEDDE